ncbi:alpha/beta hydrolase [Sphingomonas sp. VNH70]|uniref:alpha/beta fold hydrolase n=1 Tax=Sphingomonas silueang TaxID=3156617 RepID=UPI0032B62699
MIRLALVLATLATPALAQTPPPAQATTPAVQLPHVSITSMGKGPPVILIPGLSTPRAVWDGIAPVLARDHRVLLVQVNGFGGDDPRANLTDGVLGGMVADLAGYIAREKLARPAVIGHSLGGLAGMLLAARHPDGVGRLMVVDALPFIGTIMAPGMTAAEVAPRAAAMRDAVAATHGTARPSVTADPGGIWSNTAAGRIRVANWSNAADQRVVARALYDDMTTDATPEAKAIRAKPFTVLYATGAGPMATAIWTRAYAGTPAVLEPVADSYHFIMLDQPAAFAAAVERFLR